LPSDATENAFIYLVNGLSNILLGTNSILLLSKILLACIAMKLFTIVILSIYYNYFETIPPVPPSH